MCIRDSSAFRTQADIDRAKVRTKQRAEAKKLAEQEAQERAGTGTEGTVGEAVADVLLSEEGTAEEKTEPTEAA